MKKVIALVFSTALLASTASLFAAPMADQAPAQMQLKTQFAHLSPEQRTELKQIHQQFVKHQHATMQKLRAAQVRLNGDIAHKGTKFSDLKDEIHTINKLRGHLFAMHVKERLAVYQKTGILLPDHRPHRAHHQ